MFFTCAHLWTETTVTHEETEGRDSQHHEDDPRAGGGMTRGNVVTPGWASVCSVFFSLRCSGQKRDRVSHRRVEFSRVARTQAVPPHKMKWGGVSTVTGMCSH